MRRHRPPKDTGRRAEPAVERNRAANDNGAGGTGAGTAVSRGAGPPRCPLPVDVAVPLAGRPPERYLTPGQQPVT